MHINVVINDNHTFYVEETNEKPFKRGAALKTMQQMEMILAKDLQYDNRRIDKFSGMNKDELIAYFIDRSDSIRKGYLRKLDRVNPLRKKIGDDRLKLNHLYDQITAHQPAAQRGFRGLSPTFSNLHSDIGKKIASHLAFPDLANLSLLDHKAKDVANSVFLLKAKQYGYLGEDAAEAKQYLKNLRADMKLLGNLSSKKLPSWVIVKYKKQIDVEKTFENLDKLSFVELVKLLVSQRYYIDSFNHRRSYPRLQPILLKKFDALCQAQDPERLKACINQAVGGLLQAVYYACQYNNSEVLRLLLKYGASPSGEHVNFAAAAGHTELLEILGKAGADFNRYYYLDINPLRAALYWANVFPNEAAVRFLLDKVRIDQSDFLWATQRGLKKLVQNAYAKQQANL